MKVYQLGLRKISAGFGYILPHSSFIMVLVCFFILFICCFKSQAQTYSLDQVIKFSQESSPEAMRIETYKENKYWQWKSYRSQYKPQLVLNAVLPAYQHTSTPVIQDDGSIVYRHINQSQANATLSLEQNISLTGSKLFLSSDLNRLDDFNQKTGSYSGSPFFIGLQQPVFAFNELKWMNKVEPLKYEESLKEYVEGNEIIAYNTAIRYFNLLVSQINHQIALTNKANADTIYKIGTERYNMGKISRNELLQLRYGVISAQKSIATAGFSIKTSLLALNSYTGLNETEDIELALPSDFLIFDIDDSLAVAVALENSRRSAEFERETLEARRDSEKARKESRFNANLFVSYGQTNIAETVPGIYDNPQTLQMLNFGVSIPIVDWGRSKAKRKTAEENLRLVEYTVQQDEINFRQEVITEIENFRMLQDFIEYTAEADQTAEERFEIARLRYIAGDISLTEYNIALEEKDRAKQDYIIALRDYWLTYYMIRILTLYNFVDSRQLTVNVR